MTEKQTIRIMMVDDHWLYRQSLKSMLEKQPGMEIVGEAENGHVAVQKVRHLCPDVVLIDVRMPVLGGIGATRQIKSVAPNTIVIALSNKSDGYVIQEMLDAGADDYLDKTVNPKELERIIRNAFQHRHIGNEASGTGTGTDNG